MSHNFGRLLFTDAIKALQERHGSRSQYGRMQQPGASPDRLGEHEKEFISERDTFYMATLGSTGWPYVQHRGGPVGFMKVIDDSTIAFANFRGNKQYISSGNLATDNRAALILVDYPNQTRLKILGRAEILEGEGAKDLLPRVQHPEYKAVVESVFVIHVEAFDWNCPQHIIPRFTVEQVQAAMEPIESRMEALTLENEKLTRELAALRAKGSAAG